MARWNEDERWMSDEDRDEQRRWRSERQGQEWRAQDWRGDVRRDEWRGTEGRGAERGREWEERGRGYGRGGELGGGDWERERSGLGMGGRSDEGWRPTGHRESGGYGSSGYGGGRYGSSGGGTYGGSRMGSSSGGTYGGTYGGSRGGYESRGMWGEERGDERDPYGRDLSRQGGYEGRYEEQGPFERMGERMKEGFRKLTGKGPKGYKRSDERIREDVSERIARSWVNADEVEVKVEGGVVTLTGFVESREDKRRIEDVADDVFGVDEVENHIRIRRDTRAQTTGAQTTGTQATGTQTTSTTGTQTGQRTTPGTAQRPGQH